MKLFILRVGTLHMPDKSFMTPGRDCQKPVDLPVYCYLITHPKGVVLVDAGVEPEGPATVSEEESLENQLALAGFTPADIDYVILTHMHVDHAAYMSRFPQAQFIVRKEELRMAWWPDPCEHGYVYAQYRDTRDFSFQELRDDESFDLFLDGSIVCIDTRGHSRGHQSVLLNLSGHGKVLLAGDAAPLQENLDDFIQPGICTGNEDAMHSLALIRHYRMAGYGILYGHDPAQAEKLRLCPDYYD